MALTVQNLQLSYQNKVIIPNLDLTLPKNQITALIGPNGCGKSTLLKSLARLLKPTSGVVTHQSHNIWKKSAKHYAQQIAFLPQQHFIPEGIKVKELVAYGRAPYINLWGKLNKKDEKIVEKVMRTTQINELSDKLVSDLSGGQQQRVFLAMTLAQDTDIILLDEPTTYLDLNHQAELMHIMRGLQQQGKTIITVLHDLNQACRYCDYLVVLKQGQLIAEGTPQNIMTESLLKNVFDLNVEIHADPISQTPMFILKAN